MYALVLFYVKYYDLEGQVEDETIMHVDLVVSPRQFPVIPRLVLSSCPYCASSLNLPGIYYRFHVLIHDSNNLL